MTLHEPAAKSLQQGVLWFLDQFSPLFCVHLCISMWLFINIFKFMKLMCSDMQKNAKVLYTVSEITGQLKWGYIKRKLLK